ncbi:hypothetical protein OROHE_001217 [Orobanche hederae]
MTATVLLIPPPQSIPLSLRRNSAHPCLRHRSSFSVRHQASGDPVESATVYNGVYGPWKVESSAVREVILYRSGLVTAATSFVIASSSAYGDSDVLDLIRKNLDLFYGLGACGLGLSLILIHIYVTEIKRTLQSLWAIGALGSLAMYVTVAQPSGMSLVEYVVRNPVAVWFVGPLFASLTGLVFKEGLVDDIGDKSVFMFNALAEEEKVVLMEKLEEQNYSQNLN